MADAGGNEDFDIDGFMDKVAEKVAANAPVLASIPTLLIENNERTFMALFGIVCIIAGVWYVDRTWDEQGSAAYNRVVMDEGRTDDIVIPEADLDAAFPFPWAFIMGWVILGISYLFSPNVDEKEVSWPGIICLFLCIALGVIASVPMGDAVRNRNPPKKKQLGLMFVTSWILLSIFSSMDADGSLRSGGLSLVLCFLGAFCIIASMKILWKFRKMGDTWEQEGKPNPNPVVYNMGGPLFVFGWFLFWLGQTARDTEDGAFFFHVDCTVEGADCGIPIFFNVRTALCFFAGCGMVPVVMMLDYAHDEGAEYVGFGTDGRYFGRFFESPIPFVLMWTIFGVSGFFDLENGIEFASDARTWVVLFNCVAQGAVAGVLIQTALYEGDMERKNKWSVVFVLLFISLAIQLSFNSDYGGLNANGLGCGFGICGALSVIAGQKLVFGDRKRGDYFMQNDRQTNPNPIVYSAGEPVFMAGWILLSLAMSYDY